MTCAQGAFAVQCPKVHRGTKLLRLSWDLKLCAMRLDNMKSNNEEELCTISKR